MYFWRVNLKGIHESSDQALRIMGATTVMGIIMILWCGATLVAQPEKLKAPPITPNFDRKIDPVTHEPMLDPRASRSIRSASWATRPSANRFGRTT